MCWYTSRRCEDFILDLTVLQPNPFFEGPGGRSKIEDAEKARFHRYLRNIHIGQSEIIPLVYSCIGGWYNGTVDFLKMMFRKVAKGNEELGNKFFTRYRYRAAMIIAKWVGCMLQ